MNYIAILILLSMKSVYSGFCEDRKQIVKKAILNNNNVENHRNLISSKPSLLILGEPHGTHYLEKLPIIIPFLTKKLDCAFIEQPYQLQQREIDRLIAGHKTKHFQTDASFKYIPFYEYLRENEIKIIPIDNRLDHPDGISALEYMTERDKEMYRRIIGNMVNCKNSLLLVGKHHLTPDISGYKETLGHKLKETFKQDVVLVDLIAPKNMNEEYCSYRQNNLFDSKNILLKGETVKGLSYSTFVSNSFWNDFDYILHLRNEPMTSIVLD